jgi:putative RecB family exonuclease
MPRSPALQELTENLHVSHSQIFTYLACSLKYRYHYIEQRPYERISINLPFGSAIHKSIERYYRSVKESSVVEPLSHIQELFEDSINIFIDHSDIPIIYKKESPERQAVIDMGKSLLKAFYENVDLTGFQIVDVELPLSATLFSDEGKPTDIKLIGIIDLLLMDDAGELLVVDNKTAAKAKSQSAVDDDMQFSAYAYLCAANRLTFPTAPIRCRMDVLRKLKAPKLEHYHTVRTADHRKRFAKIANAVLNGIENRVFIPNRSWLCSDCGFISACDAW